MPPTDDVLAAARSALLDALEALGSHRESIVLVGAQAIHLHTGTAGFAMAPYTTDADLAVNPESLENNPLLHQLLPEAGFVQDTDSAGKPRPGAWVKAIAVGSRTYDIPVDLMVPDTLAGKGSRSADLAPHGKLVARRARGLEACLRDNTVRTIDSLSEDDQRHFSVRVAGPTALLIAKIHKLYERVTENRVHRIDAKDAGDVVRLMRAVDAGIFVNTFAELSVDPLCAATSREARGYLQELFSNQSRPGTRLAITALADDPERVAAIAEGFCQAMKG